MECVAINKRDQWQISAGGRYISSTSITGIISLIAIASAFIQIRMLQPSVLLWPRLLSTSLRSSSRIAALTFRSLAPSRHLTYPRLPRVPAEAQLPEMERPSKRTKISAPATEEETESHANRLSTSLASLQRSITPPPRSRSRSRLSQSPSPAAVSECPDPHNDQAPTKETAATGPEATVPPRLVSSPVQLTHIRDFPTSKGFNVDTVKLRDILGDPMIRECWQFNYCFDVDFLMSQFDEDVRSLVQVKVVHGSWEKESANRIRVDVRTTIDSLCSILCFLGFSEGWLGLSLT